MRSMRLIFVLFVLSLVSCFKNTEEFIPNTEIGDVNNLLNKLESNKISTLFNASENTFLLGPDEAVIEVPAGALIDAKGQLVTGSVIAEYYIDKGFALDVAEGRASRTLQEDISKMFSFSVKFKQGNVLLNINPSASGINLYVPYVDHSDINNTKLFKWNDVSWATVTDGQNQGYISTGSWNLPTENGTIFGIGYKTTVKSTGDFLIGLAKARTDNIELCINLPENYSSKNTLAIAVLPNDKVVKRLNFENGKFCSKEIARGSFVKVITLSDQAGQYLYGESSYKSSGNVVLTMVPKEKSLLEIWNSLIEL
ncbi:MAG: hypothetical protein U0V54_03895 [Saprospiraceae bacterium]